MTAGPISPRAEKAPLPRTGRRSIKGWWVATAVILLPALVPPMSLAWQVISNGTGTSVPFERLAELLLNTLILTIAVTATALTIGTTTAWLTARSDLRGRRIWMVVMAVPLVVPSYVAALTIVGATGSKGVAETWLGVTMPTPYGFLGAWLALSIFLAPMAHLIAIPALQLIDPATEEAATGLGASRRRVFFTITLPQLRPALVSAGLMIGLYTVSDFGAVSLLRFDTFTRAIYTLYQGQIDRRPAAALSLVLMVLALVILLIERRSRSRASYSSSKVKRSSLPVSLGKWSKRMAVALLGGYATIALAVPLAVLVFWVVRGVGAGQSIGNLWDEVARSLGVSLIAAFVAAVIALPIAMVTTWKRARASNAAESAVWAIYALPHITVGVAVISFTLQFARPLYQTVGLLVVVYAAMFLAQSMGPVQDSLLRASPDLEEASRGLGHGQISTLIKITLPLTRSGLVAGGALVFLSVMKELPATLLLRPNGFETLAIRVWSATGEGFFTRASVAGLALLAVSIVPLLVLTYRDLSD